MKVKEGSEAFVAFIGSGGMMSVASGGGASRGALQFARAARSSKTAPTLEVNFLPLATGQFTA